MYSIEELIKYCEINNGYYLLQVESLTTDQINLLLSKNNDNINYHLASNPNLTINQINLLLNKNNDNINYNLAINKNTSIKIKTKIIKDTIKKEIFK